MTCVVSCLQDVSPTPYTYTKVFTGEHSKTWKVKFLEQTLNGNVVQTFSVACSTDDEYTFFADPGHSYQAKTGSKKCFTAPEADVINDVWSFTNAAASLSMLVPFFDDTSPLPFIVLEAKKDKLVTEIFTNEKNTESYRIHFESTAED
jgi:hypothetical protein